VIDLNGLDTLPHLFAELLALPPGGRCRPLGRKHHHAIC
jgi:hypothetical protein